jgi:hypothetical protein
VLSDERVIASCREQGEGMYDAAPEWRDRSLRLVQVGGIQPRVEKFFKAKRQCLCANNAYALDGLENRRWNNQRCRCG